MVAPSVVCVLAQRLVARICEHCKEAYIPTPRRCTGISWMIPRRSAVLPRPRLPQMPRHRLQGPDRLPRARHHHRGNSLDDLRWPQRPGDHRTAAKIGFRPLRYDGLKKVLLGLTTVEEIEQNTSPEWAL